MYIMPKVKEIETRRKELGITRCALSIKSGLPPNAIARIEKQEVKRVHSLRATQIAKALGCKMKDVFEEVK